MKTKILLIVLSFFVIYACTAPEEKGTGYLTLNINQSTGLKADLKVEDMILRINDGRVDVIHERISNLSAEIALPVGVYTIEAYSMEFSDPKFETPFYSGKTTVEIEAGETKEASLVCSQGNAGIKIVWSDDFSILYSTYHAQIHCNEGYLHYSSTEERTGYFLPGTVSIIIQADGFSIIGGTITLAAKDMVTATLKPKNVDTQPSGSFSIEISIDQTVNEREIEVIVDPDYLSSNSETNPYNISQAIERQTENGVWVTGYIVGSKPSSGYDFVNGIWQATNIVLADDIRETNDRNVIFVELGSSGQYRTNLSLLDYPGNLHRKILLKGNLRDYQSRAGLRDLTGSFSFHE